ncbi:hypothetical protein QTN25_001508 [Entamoeba marina]
MSITPSSFDCFNQFGPKNISPDPVNNPEIFKYFAETCRNDPTRNSNNFLDLFNPRNLDGSISTQISKDFMLKENDSFITSDSKVVGQRGPAARQIHQKIEHMKEDSQKLFDLNIITENEFLNFSTYLERLSSLSYFDGSNDIV